MTFQKGHISWLKGKKMTPEQKLNLNMSGLKVGQELSGKESSTWKGDSVGYGGLHKRIRQLKGKPEQCEFCGSKNNMTWANIDGKYSCNVEDYIALCQPCHRKFDYQPNMRSASIKKFGRRIAPSLSV